MIEYLAKEKWLKVDLNADLLWEYWPETEWVFDIKNKIIKIDKSISDTPKMKFILWHEIGHFYLHNSLKINHRLYSTFQDSTYSTLEKKYELATDKDWIEWQANKFSSSLFLQKNIFMNELIRFRRDILWITTPETIFLDDQKCNQSDYFRTVNHLCTYFETTKLAIDYKLNELWIITRNEKVRGLFDSL
jgi:Zn-dependent peptidase ImmA (M78 family)